MKPVSILTAASLAVGAITVSWFIWSHYRKRRGPHPAKEWIYIGQIGAINLFPIKSCAATNVDAAECNKDGLSFRNIRDRNLLVLDDDNKLGSAMTHPFMLSIKTEILSENQLTLSAPNMPSINVNLKQILEGAEARGKSMGGYRLLLVECRPEHHMWVSKVVLKRSNGLRLFISLDPGLEMKWWKIKRSDVYPVMAVHDKSITELNSRLPESEQVDHLRFRGNLLVKSESCHQPFMEDDWTWMKIGKRSGKVDDTTILKFTEPCKRCAIINIDALTCKRNPNYEPLRTLKRFRTRSHPLEPEMGIYFDVYKTGKIFIGDPVYVQVKTKVDEL
ncbi:mitochondrial amidoxime reducing component 2-like [Teleopsis dalmanni]|uniref:mitochondrial amidoxime reducing component 2-like n=1 Tax=Teleopsis dalmanni TaxID=139649 RepID=UPI0018CD5914|nr:mitochondrial amidoxime reducing component 2-like [Teleopsis dalmanni]